MSIPFYRNTKNNLRCVHAVLRMILADNEIRVSYKNLDNILLYKDGEVVWDIQAIFAMSAFGFKSHLIDTTEYKKIAGANYRTYLKKLLGKNYEWQERHSNFTVLRALSIVANRKYGQEFRDARFSDIHKLMSIGYYVVASIDECKMDGVDGYAPHVVLITRISKSSVTFHNPGLPGQANQRVSIKRFKRGMGRKYASILAFRNEIT